MRVSTLTSAGPPLALLALLTALHAEGSDNAWIDQRTSRVAESIIELRRHIHRHPETAGNEERTAALVAGRLAELGWEVRRGAGGHGIVATLQGTAAEDGPVVAFRADMDALPNGPEQAREAHLSEVAGARHGCGHDVHTAIGVGIAAVLAERRDALPGTVMLLFQPAEETLEGAQAMLVDGAFSDPRPQAVFAYHMAPFRVGQIAIAPGVGFAGLDRYRIRITGVDATDPVVRQLVSDIEQLGTLGPGVSPDGLLGEMMRPNGDLADFIFSSVEPRAGPAGAVDLWGIFKTSDDADYPELRRRLHDLAAVLEGPALDVEIDHLGQPLPGMFSDPELSTWAGRIFARDLGDEQILTVHGSSPLNAEDFALFLHQAPGAMFFLGGANPEEGKNSMPHHPEFDVDEDAIEIGIRNMAKLLLAYLEEKRQPAPSAG